MKGSAVVQGIKSWAARFHPHLPLSVKESQRLLTALTSSFRLQLEEAHPRPSSSNEARPRPNDGDVARTSSKGLSSSAAHFADKHLASVLTNPLLAKQDGIKKPKLDYTSAKIELHKNPTKDPVLLLEKYQEQGAATPAIASLCLNTFKQSIEAMSKDNRQKAILETEAGKRVLLWLWRSKAYETDAFVDDKRLMSVMVSFVLEEGFEKYLWDWLEMDQRLGNQEKQYIQKQSVSRLERDHYHYRWKGYILRQICTAKLDLSTTKSANSAVDAFLKACTLEEIEQSKAGAKDAKSTKFPLRPAGWFLSKAITKGPLASEYRLNMGVARYDRFTEAQRFIMGERIFLQFQQALLKLYHPQSPSPLPLLVCLEAIFRTEPTASEARLLRYFENPRNDMEAIAMRKYLIAAIAQLKEGGRTEDATWLIQHVLRLYPDSARYLDKDLREASSDFKTIPVEPEPEYKAPAVVPFPTFV